LCLELDECCFSYASVPRNDTFCVPDGEQVDLYCIINNPHDDFTNLSVNWFRSTTEDTSIFDEIPATSEEYIFSKFVPNRADNSLSVLNCSHELYRDTFSLIIHRFTRHKNGYYWCQLSINNTLVQPSYRAQFSVGECNIISQNYYRLANLSERKCAKYVANELNADLTIIYESLGTSSVTSRESSTRLSLVTQQEREYDNQIIYTATESDLESSTRSSSVTQQKKKNDKPTTIYVAGSFSALLLIALLGVLALAFSFAFYVHRQRKTISKLHGSNC
jgi:hypothetical protein